MNTGYFLSLPQQRRCKRITHGLSGRVNYRHLVYYHAQCRHVAGAVVFFRNTLQAKAFFHWSGLAADFFTPFCVGPDAADRSSCRHQGRFCHPRRLPGRHDLQFYHLPDQCQHRAVHFHDSDQQRTGPCDHPLLGKSGPVAIDGHRGRPATFIY